MEIKKWLQNKIFGFSKDSLLKYELELSKLKKDIEVKTNIIFSYESVISSLKKELEELKKNPVRNLLGSIDLSQIKDPTEGMDESERKQYVQEIFGYRKAMNDIVNFLIKEQIEWWARNSLVGAFRNESEQNAFARGNINFADLILSKINDFYQEHIDNVEENRQQNLDKNKTSLPIESNASMDVLNLVNSLRL